MDISGCNKNIKVSSFISPNKNELIVVAINTLTLEKGIKIEIPGFNISKSELFKSVFIKDEKKYRELGSININKKIILPAHSVVTIRMKG